MGRGTDAPRSSAALMREATITLIQRRQLLRCRRPLPPQRRYFAHFVHKTPFLRGMTGLAFILSFPPSLTDTHTHARTVCRALWSSVEESRGTV